MISARTGATVEIGEYGRFLVSAVAVACGVGAVGYLPTLRLGGAGAIPALLAGSVVALAASAVGGVAIALAGTEPIRRPQAILLATVLRLLTAVGLGLAAVASGRFAARPLVAWIAIGYAALLAIDSRYAMRAPLAPKAPKAPRAATAPTSARQDGAESGQEEPR
jgi:hypothetical protein